LSENRRIRRIENPASDGLKIRPLTDSFVDFEERKPTYVSLR